MTGVARVLAGTAAVALTSACSIFTPPVEVSRRYAAIENVDTDCHKDADSIYCYEATLSALPVTAKDDAIALTALSDRGQAAYVAAMGSIIKDPDDLRAAIGTPLEPPDPPVAIYQDKSLVKWRFVLRLSPTNGYLNPGDRLAWAKVTITPQGTSGNAARFVSWTQLANAFETIDVGSITSTRSEKLTAETGLKIAKFAPDTKVGAEFGATTEEKADIKDRVTVSAMIRDGAATLIQTGGWRRDLAGNATFDATVALPPGDITLQSYTTVSDLKDKTTNDWTKPDAIKLGQRSVRVPSSAPLCALVELDFVTRRILSGDRSFSESNDRVRFIRGHTVSMERVAPPVVAERWEIEIVRNGGGTSPLQYALSDDETFILTFPTKLAALSFIDWMKATRTAGAAGRGKLYFIPDTPIGDGQRADMVAVNRNADSNWNAAQKACPAKPTAKPAS